MLSLVSGSGVPWPHLSQNRIHYDRRLIVRTQDIRANVELENAFQDAGFATMTGNMAAMRFHIQDGPWNSQPGEAFLVGPSLQLGSGEPSRAIPMRLLHGPTRGGVITDFMEAELQLLKEGDWLEYSYFFVPGNGGPPIWEPGDTHVRRVPFRSDQVLSYATDIIPDLITLAAPRIRWGQPTSYSNDEQTPRGVRDS